MMMSKMSSNAMCSEGMSNDICAVWSVGNNAKIISSNDICKEKYEIK
jgi:hypothetical protein